MKPAYRFFETGYHKTSFEKCIYEDGTSEIKFNVGGEFYCRDDQKHTIQTELLKSLTSKKSAFHDCSEPGCRASGARHHHAEDAPSEALIKKTKNIYQVMDGYQINQVKFCLHENQRGESHLELFFRKPDQQQVITLNFHVRFITDTLRNDSGISAQMFDTLVTAFDIMLEKIKPNFDALSKLNYSNYHQTRFALDLDIARSHALYLSYFARDLKWEKKYDEALIALQEAVKLDPSNLPILNNYADALSKTGKYVEAIHAFDAVLSRRKDDHFALEGKHRASRQLMDTTRNCFEHLGIKSEDQAKSPGHKSAAWDPSFFAASQPSVSSCAKQQQADLRSPVSYSRVVAGR